jgi:hypothetical protein
MRRNTIVAIILLLAAITAAGMASVLYMSSLFGR